MASITDRPRKRLSPKRPRLTAPGHSPTTRPTAAPEPPPQATDLPRTTSPGRPKGRPEPPPAQAAVPPTPRAGPHRLRPAGPGPHPAHSSSPRPAGPGRHPHHRRPDHRQAAPRPRRLGPGPLQQLSPRSSPTAAGPPAGWRAATSPPSWPGSSPAARSSWPAMTPSPNIPATQVYGKGCHRDPVRSTHSFTAYRWGHKWVVLAVLVRSPSAAGAGPCR